MVYKKVKENINFGILFYTIISDFEKWGEKVETKKF